MVWVGRSDGMPLVNATVTVTVRPYDNPLDSNGTRTGAVVLHTNADGIAEVFVAAPDQERTDGGGGYG